MVNRVVGALDIIGLSMEKDPTEKTILEGWGGVLAI